MVVNYNVVLTNYSYPAEKMMVSDILRMGVTGDAAITEQMNIQAQFGNGREVNFDRQTIANTRRKLQNRKSKFEFLIQ